MRQLAKNAAKNGGKFLGFHHVSLAFERVVPRVG